MGNGFPVSQINALLFPRAVLLGQGSFNPGVTDFPTARGGYEVINRPGRGCKEKGRDEIAGRKPRFEALVRGQSKGSKGPGEDGKEERPRRRRLHKGPPYSRSCFSGRGRGKPRRPEGPTKGIFALIQAEQAARKKQGQGLEKTPLRRVGEGRKEPPFGGVFHLL
jgi:hypothetical protein